MAGALAPDSRALLELRRALTVDGEGGNGTSWRDVLEMIDRLAALGNTYLPVSADTRKHIPAGQCCVR